MFNDKASEKENDQNGEKLIINEPNKEYEQIFDKAKNNVEVTEDKEINVQTNPLESVQNLEQTDLNIKDSDIHHMPDKFLKPDEKVKKKKNIFLILGIALMVIIILSVGAFAIFALREDVDDQVLDLNDDIITGDEIENIDPNALDLTTEDGRDLQRINDILEIKSALSFYYNDVGKYPYYLTSLKKYLAEMPNNPEPGGEDYYYEVEDSGDIYILRFVLEKGAKIGNLILKDGKYELNSSFGINSYNNSEPNIEPDPEPNIEPNIEPDPGLLPIPQRGEDDDDDSLTNIEELLFGTKLGLPDSDFDGYTDSEELIALYDPLKDGAKLVNNTDAVHIYNNEIFNYSVLYPAKWSAEEKSTDFKETIFYDEENGDFFKIQVNDNPQDLTIQKWYLYFSPGSDTDDLEYFENESIIGIKTKDGFNIYLANKNKVYIISYILINTEELNYFTTFEMFSNSFKIIES